MLEAISDILRERLRSYQGGLVVSARQKEAIIDSIRILNDSLTWPSDRLELKAEDLRRASEVIGRLTGRIDVEEWLGVIFSRFCVGK